MEFGSGFEEYIDISGISLITSYDGGSHAEAIQERKRDCLHIRDFQEHRIQGNISLDRRKLLFLSIPFDERWTVMVNGKEVKPVKVNLGFIGIPLERGKHEVELVYRSNYQYSLAATFLGVLICAVVWLRFPSSLSLNKSMA